MVNQFTRTELVIGKDAIEKLHNSCVAVFGLGGVGSFVVEGLVRAGVGKFILIDNDDVDITNLNRQIHATHNTIGKYKVDLMEQRILEINPDAIVKKYREKLNLTNFSPFFIQKVSFFHCILLFFIIFA